MKMLYIASNIITLLQSLPRFVVRQCESLRSMNELRSSSFPSQV